MKNNNVLITLATLLIAVAGIGWVLTSQTDNTEAVQQDRIVNTPLQERRVENPQPTTVETPWEEELIVNRERPSHHRGHRNGYNNQQRQHCHDGWTE